MNTIHTIVTPFGNFKLTRGSTKFITMYKAVRSFRKGGRSVQPGDHFTVEHRKIGAAVFSARTCVGGERMGAFDLDGDKLVEPENYNRDVYEQGQVSPAARDKLGQELLDEVNQPTYLVTRAEDISKTLNEQHKRKLTGWRYFTLDSDGPASDDQLNEFGKVSPAGTSEGWELVAVWTGGDQTHYVFKQPIR